MTSAEPMGLEDAQKVLADQPFNALIGARLTVFEPGRSVLEIDIRDELRQQYGILHGGVLSYAADNTLTFAAGSVLGPNVITSGFTINYLRPALGRMLRAEAEVLHAGRRQAVCRCDLYVLDDDGQSTLCGGAQGTILTLESPASF